MGSTHRKNKIRKIYFVKYKSAKRNSETTNLTTHGGKYNSGKNRIGEIQIGKYTPKVQFWKNNLKGYKTIQTIQSIQLGKYKSKKCTSENANRTYRSENTNRTIKFWKYTSEQYKSETTPRGNTYREIQI